MPDSAMRTIRVTAVAGFVLSISGCAPASHDHDHGDGHDDTAKAEAPARSVVELSQLEHITAVELEPLADEDIWKLGVDRFKWSPTEAPEDWSRKYLVKVFLEDERIKNYDDGIGAEYIELGYDDE